MSDGPMTPGFHGSEEIDPGVPIDQLASFERDVSTGFLGRIRRRIQRRTTVSQLVSFSWSVPILVLLEFWIALADQLSPKSVRKDHQR